jgi:hemerythrin-like domain-containing protein
MALKNRPTRRDFIFAGSAAGGGILLAGLAGTNAVAQTPAQQSDKTSSPAGEDISPAEDLMREHGLFERILLIYEKSIADMKSKTAMNPATLHGTAKISRAFIEDYHSKLEDEQVFPRLAKAGKLVDLVKLLSRQHQAGRKLTDLILQLTSSEKILDDNQAQNLSMALMQFVRMYRPHLAREDTVVFPAMHAAIPPSDYDIMGDQFEDLEHKLFGEHGFENVVEQVAGLEKSLGIYELSQFTAPA